MADIRYTPITGGQAFGNAGKFFESATKSLNRATAGASAAFNTVQQGAVDAKDKRTQDAITAIQGARTVEEYDALASNLTSPEQFSQSFGDIDVNKAVGALRAQQGIAQSNFVKDAEFAKTRIAQNDQPLLDQFLAANAGSNSSELERLDINNLNLGLENKLSGQDALRNLRQSALTTEDATFARGELERTRNDAALVRRDKDSLKNLETQLRSQPSEILQGLTADSFDIQLEDPGAAIALRNSILSERQATTVQNQTFDKAQKELTDTAATQSYIESQNLSGIPLTKASVNSWAKANNIDPNTANKLVNQFNLNTGATEANAVNKAKNDRLTRLADAAEVASTKHGRKVETDAKDYNDEFSLSVSASDDGLFNVTPNSSVKVTETLAQLRAAGVSESDIKTVLISGKSNGFFTADTFDTNKVKAKVNELLLKSKITDSGGKLAEALTNIGQIGRKAPLERDANNAALVQSVKNLFNP